MKMVQGTGSISDYGNYVRNCTMNQYPYKIPVNNLQDVQLYIDIGGIKPSYIQYQLIYTCGSLGGTIETLTTSSYVVGQTSTNYWYGVFKSFNDAANPLTCFVIAITLTINDADQIYFSDEYCVEPCRMLTEVKGCYGNLDSNISTNCQDIYFGVHAGEDTAMGDTTVVYEHKMLLRDAEVYLTSIKNTFKQGRTRNFRTEKEKIFQFNAEFVPAWYLDEVDAVFYRGEIFFDGTHYLVNETAYELIDDCKKTWKIPATLKESCYQSFSCEVDPCSPPVQTCCDPEGITATVEFEDSGESGVETCCDPEVISADVSFSAEYSEIFIGILGSPATATDDVIGLSFLNKSYTAGRLYLFVTGFTGASSYGSVTGTTLTWNIVAQIGDATRRLAIYSCIPGSDVSGEDVTCDSFGGSTGHFSVLYEILGLPNTEVDAMPQVVTDSDTSANPSLSMAALNTNAKNAVLAIFVNSLNPFGGTVESGWTENFDSGYNTPTEGSYIMQRYQTTDNTPTVTAANSDWLGIAIELAAAEVLP